MDIENKFAKRPNSELLDPRTFAEETPPVTDLSLPSEHSELVRQAEGMVHYLQVQSKMPALLLEDQWKPVDEPFSFENHATFQEVAAKSGCVVKYFTRPDSGGTRHLLFLGQSESVSEEQYMECIPSRMPNLS